MLSQAQGVAATPYTPYTGELVAPVNYQENLGIGGVNNYANFALPSIQSGLTAAQAATAPVTQSQINQYESPFTQQVINATQAQFNNQNAQQSQQVNSNAIAQGAMGGNRVGVAQAELANQQQLAQAPVIANLQQQGYTTGLNTALTEQQAQLMGAYGQAGIGSSGQAALLSGAGQQIGAGQLQQTTQQALDTALYQQYLNQMAYPFQTTQYLAGIEGSIGPQMGGSGTASTTGPSPSLISQIAGLGTLGTGLFGSSGAIPYLGSLLSDKRVKENIKAIGKLNDGQTLYKFNYKGDPTVHVGLIAQEVEKEHPEAVHRDPHGIRLVDYDRATRDAEGVAKRQYGGGMMEGPMMAPSGVAGAGGGVTAAPSTPYAPSSSSYVPAAQLAPAYPFSWRLPNAPPAPNTNSQPINAQGVAQMGKAIFGTMNNPTNTATPSNGVAATPTGGYSPIGTAPAINNPTMFIGPQFSSDQAVYHQGGRVRNRDDGGGLDPDAGPPMSIAPTGVAAPPPNTASPPAMPLSFAPTASPSDGSDIANWQRDISGLEQDSRGYGSLGPVVQSGDRAYGKYQIMGNNVGPWTKEVLGQEMTPQDFLQNPQAQDAVFNAKFGQYVNKYGPEGAARAWIGGPGGVNNPNAMARDANGNPIGLSVGDYGHRFMTGAGPSPNATVPLGVAGGTDQSSGVAASPGFMQKLFPNVDFSANSKLWPALIAAGAGMMASRSPFPGVAIGEGAQAGLNEYQLERSTEASTQMKQQELNINSRKLQMEIDKMATDYNFRLRQEQLNQQKEQRESQKPVEYATGVDDWGNPTRSYAVKGPNGVWLDTQTNKPVSALNGGPSPPTAGASTIPPPTTAAPASPPPVATRPVPTAAGAVPPTTVPAPAPAPSSGGISPPPSTAVAPSAAPPSTAAPVAPPQITQTPATASRPSLPYNPSLLPRGVDPATVDPKTGLGKDGRDYAYLQSIPDRVRGTVQGLTNYNYNPQSLGFGRQRAAILDAATKFDPSYNADYYDVIKRTEEAFGTGKQGDSVRAFNTALLHEQTLAQYAKALGNGDLQMMNRLKNAFAQQFGVAAPTTFDGLKQIVGQEIVKSIVPGGGGVTERQELADHLSRAQSPQQFAQMIEAYQELGAAQLDGLKRQWLNGTYSKRGDFATQMQLNPIASRLLKQEEARVAATAGNLPSYASPADVQAAKTAGKIKSGDYFLIPGGRIGQVP